MCGECICGIANILQSCFFTRIMCIERKHVFSLPVFLNPGPRTGICSPLRSIDFQEPFNYKVKFFKKKNHLLILLLYFFFIDWIGDWTHTRPWNSVVLSCVPEDELCPFFLQKSPGTNEWAPKQLPQWLWQRGRLLALHLYLQCKCLSKAAWGVLNCYLLILITIIICY